MGGWQQPVSSQKGQSNKNIKYQQLLWKIFIILIFCFTPSQSSSLSTLGRAKLKDQQQHQHKYEQPTAQIIPHMCGPALKWQQNAITCRRVFAKHNHRDVEETCQNLKILWEVPAATVKVFVFFNVIHEVQVMYLGLISWLFKFNLILFCLQNSSLSVN